MLGYHCIVLHAHLPYIRHPEYDSFFEENWLFEAITETYVPILNMLRRKQRKGYRQCLTLSLSPTLISMLADSFLQKRFRSHIDKLRHLAELEVIRTKDDPHFLRLAQLYQQKLETVNDTYFDEINGDLISAFVELHKANVIELITSAATHGFLPLLKAEPSTVRAQLKTGAQTFFNMTGVQAQGVWLPECGYYEGLEAIVEDAGFGYFFVDSHGILNSKPRPYYGLSAPLLCPNGIAAFGRDPATSRQVWSRDEGYPGDFYYRDFYRDIGFDLEMDYIRPFILDGETRIHTGFKYYRITGHNVEKEVYDLERAQEQINGHADDFVKRALVQLGQQESRDKPAPLITSPYDAELFGHWWFEGPGWLEAVIEHYSKNADKVALSTPSAYLKQNPMLQVAEPSASSWGNGGYNAFWLNEGNDWIYPYLHDASKRMQSLVELFQDAEPGTLTYRALQQAGRSLLMAEASDWAFFMKTGTAQEYAYNRTRDHLARFNYLETVLRNNTIDERRLQALEVMDPIFPNLVLEYFG
jgi:1,4-alpha-glucan branching enzyme